MTAPPARRLVLVVGPGGWLLARILGRLGFHAPLPALEDGEPRSVAELHDLLEAGQLDQEEAAGRLRSWLAVHFVGADDVVVSEGRILHHGRLWRRCAHELGVDLAIAVVHVEAAPDAPPIALDGAGGHRPRLALVSYDELLEDWPRAVSGLGERLDDPRLVGIEPAQQRDVDALVATVGVEHPAPATHTVTLPSALFEEVGQAAAKTPPVPDRPARRPSLDRRAGKRSALSAALRFVEGMPARRRERLLMRALDLLYALPLPVRRAVFEAGFRMLRTIRS
jgi:hypothetical protein